MDAAQKRIDLLRHLEYFIAVADERHFGRAADVVGISQPPLSQGLRRLERHVGSALFERNSRGVTLTPTGRALLPHARRVLADADALMSTAARSREAPVGLRIGMSPQTPLSLVVALVSTARRVLAGQRVEQVVAPTSSLLHEVSTGRLDLGLVRHPAPVAGLAAGPVVRLPGRLLVAADHQLAQADWVALTDIARFLPLALAPRAHHPGAHDHLLDVIARHGVRIASRSADDDRAAMVVAASGTAGAVTADADLASDDVRNLVIDGDPMPLRLRMIRGVDAEDPIDGQLLDTLQDVVARHGQVSG